MNKKLLIHAWQVERKGSDYYLLYCHWIYLKEIIQYFDEVVLVSACKVLKETDETKRICINNLGNITVYELPSSSKGYVGSLKYFFFYLRAYRSLKNITTYYSRYPTPFGWLQKLYGKNKQRIIHYVGDPADAAINNPNFSYLKKKVLVNGFYIEDSLYTWACKGAEVYTNGHHLSEKLLKKGIDATPLISSTLTQSDFFYTHKKIRSEKAKFIYLGYLRTAKGVETVINAFSLYNKKYPDSVFTIIGSGEFEHKLKSMVVEKNVKNVKFLGQVEDREIINQELRKADVFLFGSLSEGSPRVVLEAMANGLAVISTPVGSLPRFFENNNNIIFAEFNDPNDFFKKMVEITSNPSLYEKIRENSYCKVKKLTISYFINSIFS